MQQLCERFVQSYPFIEAALIFSADNTFAWNSRKSPHPGPMLNLAESLITTADELHLFNSVPGATVTFDTSFGAVYLCALDMEHVLILFMLEGYSLHLLHESLTDFLKSLLAKGATP